MLRHVWLNAPKHPLINGNQSWPEWGVTGNTPVRLTLQNSPTIDPIKQTNLSNV